MKMHSYIADTEYAVRSLVEALAVDRTELQKSLDEQRAALDQEAYFDLAFLQRQMHPSANYWYGQLMEAQGQRNALDSEIARLEAKILDKKFSLSALAGALLQIAKQGISVVRRHPDSCPDGRLIFGVPIKRIIWASRNQSLHFEEPKKIDSVTEEIFQAMARDGGPKEFADPKSGINLALLVVENLDWFSFERYRDDMISLLG